MDEEVRQILLKYLEIEFNTPNHQITIELEEWDSLRSIQIALEIEDKYGIEISDEDLFLLTSHQSICNYLNSNLRKSE